MRIFFTDVFELPLPEGHRFPMAKYRLLRERVAGAGLGTLHLPPAATDAELARAHDPEYVARVVEGRLTPHEIRRIGFPWSPGLVERSRRSAGATIAACRAALEDGVGVNLAGGTHHAGPDWGAGYCVFNDASVAARALQAERRVERVLVVDLDVHQGNGTAAIHRDDPSVFTLSVHAARNFPFRKEPGDLDVELPDGTGDEDYLREVEYALWAALPRARADLVIYVSGADAFARDALGRLSLSKAGLLRRDELVLGTCRDHGLPVAVTMAGGYARDLHDIVEIHFGTVRVAAGLDGRPRG